MRLTEEEEARRRRAHRFRKERGWTIKEMAAKCGTPYRTYKAWEAGYYRFPGLMDLALEALERREKDGNDHSGN